MWPTQSNIKHNFDYKMIVSDQKTSLAGGKQRKYTKQTVRQMNGWLGREF